MGAESDQEIIQLVGTESNFVASLNPSFQECAEYNIHTREKALEWIGNRIRMSQRPFGAKKMSKVNKNNDL